MSIVKRFAIGALMWTTICALGPYPAVSQASPQREASPSGTAQVNLVAVMPSTAHVAWWVIPTPATEIMDGQRSDLLVIEQQWLLAPGASADARCTVIPAFEQSAELISLDPATWSFASAGFLPKPSVKTISLPAPIHAGKGSYRGIHALVVVHRGPPADPAVIHIVVDSI